MKSTGTESSKSLAHNSLYHVQSTDILRRRRKYHNITNVLHRMFPTVSSENVVAKTLQI